MEIKNFTITKRDGSKDSFSLDKIMNAIVKAFESVNAPSDLGTIYFEDYQSPGYQGRYHGGGYPEPGGGSVDARRLL